MGLGLIIYGTLYIRRKRNKKKYIKTREEEYLNYYHSILPQSRIYRGASDIYTQPNLAILAESFQKEKSDGSEGVSRIAELARLMQVHSKPMDTEETSQTVCLTDVCAEIPNDLHVYEYQVTEQIPVNEIQDLPHDGEIKSVKNLNESSVSRNEFRFCKDMARLCDLDSEPSSSGERNIVAKLEEHPHDTTRPTDSSKIKTEHSSTDARKFTSNSDFLPPDTAGLSQSLKSYTDLPIEDRNIGKRLDFLPPTTAGLNNSSNYNTKQSSIDDRHIPIGPSILSPLAGVTDKSKAKTTESSNERMVNVQKLDLLSPDRTRLSNSSKSKPDSKTTHRKPKSHIFTSLLENLTRMEVFTVSENQPTHNHINKEEMVTGLDDINDAMKHHTNDAVKLNVLQTASTETHNGESKLAKWVAKDRNDNFIQLSDLVDCNTDKHSCNKESNVVIFHDDYLTGTWI